MSSINFEPGPTFTNHPVMAYAERNLEDERLALNYMNKNAPDLIGMVLGHVL